MSNNFHIIYLISCIIYFVIWIILTIICFKRYYIPKSIRGDIVLSLQKSNRIVTKKAVAYFAILFILNFRFTSTEFNIGTLLPSVFSIITLALIAWFDFQPQKVCTKGILIRSGFITWDMIKKVEPVSEMDDTVVIILFKPRFGDSKFNLYCLPGMGTMVETYVNQCINN